VDLVEALGGLQHGYITFGHFILRDNPIAEVAAGVLLLAAYVLVESLGALPLLGMHHHEEAFAVNDR